jgi:hypothetical protein
MLEGNHFLFTYEDQGSLLTPKPSPTPTSTQTPAEVVAVPASPTPKAAAAKKTTISCIKGKLTKKVSAVNPKCPAGYKKK